jgi:hypothetical protein
MGLGSLRRYTWWSLTGTTAFFLGRRPSESRMRRRGCTTASATPSVKRRFEEDVLAFLDG